jgi:hypothetical protein
LKEGNLVVPLPQSFLSLVASSVLLAILGVPSVSSQSTASNPAIQPPRFEDYEVNETFTGPPVAPQIVTLEERQYRTKIREGVDKGYGIEGSDGKERPGPNFAGPYFVITWGCGSPCLMAAIVDAKTGRVYPPPFHHGPGHSYFQVPWAFPATPPLNYRLDSRLLIANICESDTVFRLDGQVSYQAHKCGPHYFLMGENGLRLIHRVLE